MRLNRVLLLAATINILIFALVFTISCSNGDDGKAGKDGDRCFVNEDYDIICNGQPIGSLTGGKGPNGQPGPQGPTGETGSGCWVAKATTGAGWNVLCGKGDGELKGILDGCTVTEGFSKFELDIKCGDTQVAICGREIFDTDLYRCEVSQNSGADTLILTTESPIDYCGPQKTEYDRRKQYCGWGETDIGEASTVYNNCPKGTANGSILVYPNSLGWAKEYCAWATDSTVVKSDTYCDDGKPVNQDVWKGQYCGYKSSGDAKTSQLDKRCEYPGIAIYPAGTAPGTPSATPCASYTFETGSAGAPGWGSRTVVNAVALDSNGTCLRRTANKPDSVYGVYGPNQAAFGQGYCTVLPIDKTAKTKDGKAVTTYTEFVCGGDFAKGKVNQDSWKGQYCGYGKDSKFADQVLSGGSIAICGNGEGPAELVYDRFFCGYGTKEDKVTRPLPFCWQVSIKGTGANDTSYTKSTYNTTKYNGDYCGFKFYSGAYAYSTGSTGANKKGKSYADVIDNDYRWLVKIKDSIYGANAASYGIIYPDVSSLHGTAWTFGDTLITASSSSVSGTSYTTQHRGLCGDNRGAWQDTSDANFGGYCQFYSARKYYNYGDSKLNNTTCNTTLTAGKIDSLNAGAWKGEYCGFDYTTAGSSAKKVYPGACDFDGSGNLPDDGIGPYSTQSAAGRTTPGKFCGYVRPGSLTNQHAWNEYGVTEYVTGTVALDTCGNVNNSDNLATNAPANKYNAATLQSGGTDNKKPPVWTGKFVGDYCGWNQASSADSVYLKGECDYATGSVSIPSGYSYTTDSYASDWFGQYAAYEVASSATGNSYGLNNTGFKITATGPGLTVEGEGGNKGYWGGYCAYVPPGSWDNNKGVFAKGTVLSTDYCYNTASTAAGKLEGEVGPKPMNQGTWKNEYCDMYGVVYACPGNWAGSRARDSKDANFCQARPTPKKAPKVQVRR